VEQLPRTGPLRCTGGRRPLRFLPKDVATAEGTDDHGAYVEVRFGLDSGCYATVLLREVCKDGLVGDV